MAADRYVPILLLILAVVAVCHAGRRFSNVGYGRLSSNVLLQRVDEVDSIIDCLKACAARRGCRSTVWRLSTHQCLLYNAFAYPADILPDDDCHLANLHEDCPLSHLSFGFDTNCSSESVRPLTNCTSTGPEQCTFECGTDGLWTWKGCGTASNCSDTWHLRQITDGEHKLATPWPDDAAAYANAACSQVLVYDGVSEQSLTVVAVRQAADADRLSIITDQGVALDRYEANSSSHDMVSTGHFESVAGTKHFHGKFVLYSLQADAANTVAGSLINVPEAVIAECSTVYLEYGFTISCAAPMWTGQVCATNGPEQCRFECDSTGKWQWTGCGNGTACHGTWHLRHIANGSYAGSPWPTGDSYADNACSQVLVYDGESEQSLSVIALHQQPGDALSIVTDAGSQVDRYQSSGATDMVSYYTDYTTSSTSADMVESGHFFTDAGTLYFTGKFVLYSVKADTSNQPAGSLIMVAKDAKVTCNMSELAFGFGNCSQPAPIGQTCTSSGPEACRFYCSPKTFTWSWIGCVVGTCADQELSLLQINSSSYGPGTPWANGWTSYPDDKCSQLLVYNGFERASLTVVAVRQEITHDKLSIVTDAGIQVDSYIAANTDQDMVASGHFGQAAGRLTFTGNFVLYSLDADYSNSPAGSLIKVP